MRNLEANKPEVTEKFLETAYETAVALASTSQGITGPTEAARIDFHKVPGTADTIEFIESLPEAMLALHDEVVRLRKIEERSKNQHKQVRRHAKKAAVSNREAEALRLELQKTRTKNYLLQGYVDNPASQAGYRVRYEKLAEKLKVIQEVVRQVEVHGLPEEAPKTLPAPSVPAWLRLPK